VRVALDTNILAYAEGVNGATMRETAFDIIEKLPADAVMLPVQVLGELFRVLVTKAKRTPTQARKAVIVWRDAFPIIDTSVSILMSATDLATDHQVGIWDAVILSAAAEADCRLLLTEDLAEGFTWRGATATNPFASRMHPILSSLIAGP
jgi:predicted nucleic acid-binding protein